MQVTVDVSEAKLHVVVAATSSLVFKVKKYVKNLKQVDHLKEPFRNSNPDKTIKKKCLFTSSVSSSVEIVQSNLVYNAL